MRNLAKYPITKQEITKELVKLYEKEKDNLAPGDMKCYALHIAARVIDTISQETLDKAIDNKL